MSRTLLSCLGLALSGAALVATSGAATPAVAGVVGGFAGNLATDLYKALDRRVAERFLDGWSGIDENHSVNRALRLAALHALRATLGQFNQARATDTDDARRRRHDGFAARLEEFLVQEVNVARSVAFARVGALTAEEVKIRQVVLGKLPDAFDQSLAARRATGDRGAILESQEQIQRIAETAVIEEIRLRSRSGDEAIPELFLSAFTGDQFPNGWFDLFVRDAAAALKDGGEFERIWNAEQTAFVAAIARSYDEMLRRIESKIDALPDGIVENLIRVLAERNRASSASSAEFTAASRALPTPPVRILGRDREIDRIVTAMVGPSKLSLSSLLGRETMRSVVILGGPGIGKSTLTQEVACRPEIVTKFGDRRYFVQLEDAKTIDSFRRAIFDAFDLHGEPKIEAIAAFAEANAALLILDNLETTHETCAAELEADLTRLAGLAPKCALLASFRGNNAPPAPRWSLRHRLEPLDNDTSRTLFLEIAPEVSETDPALPDLIKELGGVPLAIELVAMEAAPFANLADILERWRGLGTTMARRRDASASRTSSLDFSLELSVTSVRRHTRSLELMSIVAWLNGGVDREIARIVFGESFYEIERDLLSSGLVLQSHCRIDMLPPVRRYIAGLRTLSTDLVGSLVGPYIALLQALFLEDKDTIDEATDQAVGAEAENFMALSWYTATRLARSELVSLTKMIVERLMKWQPDLKSKYKAAPYIRVLTALGVILDYGSSRSLLEREWVQYAECCFYSLVCEKAKDLLIFLTTRTQLQLMEADLLNCLPEVRNKVEPIVNELRTVLETYMSEHAVDEAGLYDGLEHVEALKSAHPQDFVPTPPEFEAASVDFERIADCEAYAEPDYPSSYQLA